MRSFVRPFRRLVALFHLPAVFLLAILTCLFSVALMIGTNTAAQDDLEPVGYLPVVLDIPSLAPTATATSVPASPTPTSTFVPSSPTATATAVPPSPTVTSTPVPSVSCSTFEELSPPILISPAHGSNLNTLNPFFEWEISSEYQYAENLWFYADISKDPNFASTEPGFGVGMVPGSTRFRFRLSYNFEPATTYYWHGYLRCQAPGSTTRSSHSETASFTTGSGGAILPAPALIAPPNTSTVAAPVTVQWSPVEGAVDYLVYIRPQGASFRTIYTATETQLSVFTEPNTTYEWWVAARNEYAAGDDSEIWQFTTTAEGGSGGWQFSVPPFDDSVIVRDDGSSISQ